MFNSFIRIINTYQKPQLNCLNCLVWLCFEDLQEPVQRFVTLKNVGNSQQTTTSISQNHSNQYGGDIRYHTCMGKRQVLTTRPLLWVYYSWRNRYLDLRYFAGRSGYKIFLYGNVSINLQDSVSQMTGEDRGTFQPVPFLGLPVPFVEKYNVAVRAQGQQSPLK